MKSIIKKKPKLIPKKNIEEGPEKKSKKNLKKKNLLRRINFKTKKFKNNTKLLNKSYIPIIKKTQIF